MAYEYIKEENLKSTYDDHVAYMAPLFQPFDEFERIARNRPHPGIAKGLPRVTDGTLAALIQEQPKRIIQQVPTGKVKGDSEWISIVAGFIFENEILPNSNMTAALIQKCWAMTSKSLTYGAQPVFVQFVNRGDYFGTDFTLPYIKDVLLEPGKLSDKDSNCIMLRSWYREADIERIIDKENFLAKRAKERGEKYESTWDLEVLQRAIDDHIEKEKQQEAQTANEKDKNTKNTVIEMVHVFQRGIGMTFYSFFPDLPDEENVCRRKKNRDPRGQIPIHYMYANVDLSNPLGRGSVELSGGMQNLLDSEVQAYQYMRALLMNPPLEIKGNVRSSIIKYAPAAQWKLGTDPNASVKPVDLSTSSLESFPNNYGLIKSQILNLNQSTDTSVSSEVGNPGFSKTPAGVDAQQQRLGVSDNYMRKQFESTFEDIAETEINLYFAERHGIQELQLDKDTAQKLRKIDPEAVSDDDKIRIDFDDATEQLKFEVDASTSSMKDDAAERDRLIELLDLSGKYPQFGELMGKDGTKELVNRIVVKSGVEDPEKIMPTAEDSELDEQGNPKQPEQDPNQMTPDMVQQMVEQGIKQNAMTPEQELTKALIGKFDSLPPDTKKALIEELGLPADEPAPATTKTAVDKFTAAANQVATPPSPEEQQAQADQAAAQQQQAEADRTQKGELESAKLAASQQPTDGSGTQTPPAQEETPQEPETPQEDAGEPQPEQPQPGEEQGPQEPQIDPADVPPEGVLVPADGQQGDVPDAEDENIEDFPPETVEPLDNLTPDLDEDDKMLIAALQQRGFTNEQIGEAVAMMKDGHDIQDILEALTREQQEEVQQ